MPLVMPFARTMIASLWRRASGRCTGLNLPDWAKFLKKDWLLLVIPLAIFSAIVTDKAKNAGAN
jgi:hypothetical protein